MMCAHMVIFVVATYLPLTSASQTATQVVLGGLWFSQSSVGTSGSYMLSEWRDKICNPLMSRVEKSDGEHDETERASLVSAINSSVEQFLDGSHILQVLEEFSVSASEYVENIAYVL